MTLKIQLKCAWSKAKTNAEGVITGWDDYKIGDIIEVNEPIPLSNTEYERIEEKQEINKQAYSQRGRSKNIKQ